MKQKRISGAALERLPLYLRYLRSADPALGATVSATALARALNLGEVQVRKDLNRVSGAGRPKIGYDTRELTKALEDALGCRSANKAVLVGAGRLGMALYGYDGFAEYGLEIGADFDSDSARIGRCGDKPVLPLSVFSDYCRREKPKIGILTVPDTSADAVCGLMIENGILAVWNFSGRRLHVPDHILVRDENMASSLAVLSDHLNRISNTTDAKNNI